MYLNMFVIHSNIHSVKPSADKVEKKVEGYNEEMWIEKKWSCVHVVKRRKCVKVATNVEVEYVKKVRVV